MDISGQLSSKNGKKNHQFIKKKTFKLSCFNYALKFSINSFILINYD